MLITASEISCLHFAAAGGDDEASTAVVEILVKAGSVHLPLQADSRLGWTPLHNAVYSGHIFLVGKLSKWMEQACDLEEERQSVEALQKANMNILWEMPQMAPVDSR